MRNRRQRQPEVEALEAMTLLSGAAQAFNVHGAAVVIEPNTVAAGQRTVAPESQAVSVSGRVTGSYSASETASGGEAYTFNGSGFVAPLGVASMTGTTQVSVFTTAPSATFGFSPASGTITLSNASGTITFALTGPDINMAAIHPDTWHYTISSATGAYQGETASGYVVFMVNPTVSGSTSEVGTFTLIFMRRGTPPPP
jgi:hypothetical protein